jgi:phenylacetate-CoA ligase
LKVYSLSSIVALARVGSSFYGQFYAQAPVDPALTDLPVLDPAQFWAAHQRDRREVLTRPLTDGIVFNSGGTTGQPKFSYLSEDECQSSVEISVRSFDAALQEGDRVANFFVAGGLHASYLFATDSIRLAHTNVLHLPIAAHNPFPDSARLIRDLDVNVLAGIPTHLVKLVEYLAHEGMGHVRFRSILYAGENFTAAQRAYLEGLFPGVKIHSAGYASVDAGAMAFADEDCAPGEHRVLDAATILEILDEETGVPITQAGQPGRVIFTSLVRQLMPIIRYPVGDRAVWLEPPGTPMRKFGLLGRTEEDIALAGNTVLRISDVRALLEPFRERLGITKLQVVVATEDGRDGLTFRLVGGRDKAELAAATPAMIQELASGHPILAKLIAAGALQTPRLEWISEQDLIVSPRTVKMLKVVDRRKA